MKITLDLRKDHLGTKDLRRRIFRGRISSFINKNRILDMETKVLGFKVKDFQSREAIIIHQEISFLNRRKLLDMGARTMVELIMQIIIP